MGFEMSYEIRKVSNDKAHIINELREETNLPVGILVFGPDFSSKPKIFDDFFNAFSPYIIKVNEADMKSFESPRGWTMDGVEECGIIFMMNGDDSTSKRKRQEAVKAMKNVGAQTIIGVYANRWICEKDDDLKVMFARNSQVDGILTDPPTAEDFDYLIIVT